MRTYTCHIAYPRRTCTSCRVSRFRRGKSFSVFESPVGNHRKQLHFRLIASKVYCSIGQRNAFMSSNYWITFFFTDAESLNPSFSFIITCISTLLLIPFATKCGDIHASLHNRLLRQPFNLQFLQFAYTKWKCIHYFSNALQWISGKISGVWGFNLMPQLSKGHADWLS